MNPIHLSALTAKALGFKHAIAHGMWVKARTLAALAGALASLAALGHPPSDQLLDTYADAANLISERDLEQLQETDRAGDALEAYERLILDAMRGDHTLFTTAEGIERLWEVSAPLLQDPPPVRLYAPGSWGPNAIHQLIAPHAWRLPFERVWRDKR